MSKFLKILLIILILTFALPNFQSSAVTSLQERQTLEQEYEKLKERIAQYEADISKTEREKRTLRNQISILRSRVEKLDLQIHQNNIMIRDISVQIEDTEFSINQTSLKIENSRERLAKVLQLIYKEGQKSMIEILLSETKLSNFFDNLIALETLNLRNQELLGTIKELKVYLESQKQSLEGEKTDFERLVKIQILQKNESARTRKEQEHFLRMSEAEYQKYIRGKAEAEKKAAEIRARIFELIGVPEAPTFGEALEISIAVERITGIRPAFLLAIITQESALGRNVGQCYLPRDPAENKRRRVMHPTRDVPPFLNITQELGRDPYNTLISCPMAFGFGGAMGPAQFIPSTWANRLPILKEFVQNPNPWNIHHAFLASALYLRDSGGRNNERQAALRYFAGGNWANPRFAFYGNQVMRRISCLQTFIDHGTMSAACGEMIFIPK